MTAPPPIPLRAAGVGRWATLTALGILVLVLAAAGGAWLLRSSQRFDREQGVHLTIRLWGDREEVQLISTTEGYLFIVEQGRGERRLSPEEFAASLHDRQRSRDWLAVLLNISNPMGIAWVALGLLGQLLFAARMVIQWLHSERHRRSMVPPIFWWLSLGGSLMLLTYFLWRTDIVGIIGQGLGFVIYTRNLMLLRSARAVEPDQP